MRVVFDTSVLVRAVLRSPAIAHILARVADPRIRVLRSDLLLEELAHCVVKPRLATHVDWTAYEAIVDFLIACGEDVSVQPPFPVCRDPDDAYLLAMAANGRADFLVSLDLDLLCLSQIDRCRIVTPTTFDVELHRFLND